MAFGAWMRACDRLAAFATGGMMTDDIDFDWRASYEWGDTPEVAVRGATRKIVA